MNCIGALSFFKICSHIFMILKSNWSGDFGHAETGNGAKKRVVFQEMERKSECPKQEMEQKARFFSL